ncbi:MAG: AmmeMemoRadiSam system radical SAM enzyme [Dactylosporangium sp.]|nr:AmmeMemoRadiSam system radical SAM enzyme [Dactylosporangium sp.]NNJ59674.1 AmmeMemoRadiSam system radical SAM enzyme [Dactylosporangium sp.]
MPGSFPSGSSALSLADGHTVPTDYWRALPDGRLECGVCPRACRLREGQRGRCFVRGRVADQIVLASYGRSSGFCVDPIEKKPLNHVLPGSAVLSFGTAGCHLSCKFCQNWDISRSREMDTLSAAASPDTLAAAAERLGCGSVAFTYNDPVIFMEYAMDVADACRDRGIAAIAVSAGYMNPAPRAEFYRHMDAANIDLKGFTEAFYRKLTGAALRPVLQTLEYLATTDTWFEITTLLIPGYNDADDVLARQCRWIVEQLGPDVPVHFSAFTPAYKLRNVPATPPETLKRAGGIARDHGLRYVYAGNVHDPAQQTTSCPTCANPVIVRNGYAIERCALTPSGRCAACGTAIPGRFATAAGRWGQRRMPVHIADLEPAGTGSHDRRRPS